jgi:hypothetical protein
MAVVKPQEAIMNTLSSHDGTTIAYDKRGEGPALILVDGALTVHSSGSASELTKLLAPFSRSTALIDAAAAGAGTRCPTRSTGRSTTSRR